MHAQGVMRTLSVILFPPAIKAPLLGCNARCGGSGRFRLEHLVHLLVGGIVVGASWAAMFHCDVELDPPDAERAPAMGSSAPERRPVVGADGMRESVTSKLSVQDPTHLAFRGAFHVPHQQHKSAGQVAHRQRTDSSPIAGSEPPLEVDRPHVVRRQRQTRLDQDGGSGPGMVISLGRQPRGVQPTSHRANARPWPEAKLLLQVPQEFRGTGKGMGPAHGHHPDKPALTPSDRGFGAVGTIRHGPSFLLRPPYEGVPGFAAHPAASTDFSQAQSGVSVQFQKRTARLCFFSSFPRHPPRKL
jgi:hypothetical protein